MTARLAERRWAPARPAVLAATLAVLAVLLCAAWVALDILAREDVWSNSGQPPRPGRWSPPTRRSG